MDTNKIAKLSAMTSALVFFIYSIVQLINFAISQKAISLNSSKIISLVYNKTDTISTILIIVLFFTSLLVYLGYLTWTKNKKQRIFKYILFMSMISVLIWTISLVYVFYPNYSIEILNQKNAYGLISIMNIILGIIILSYKENRSNILLAIAPLYILQGIFVFLSRYTFVQLAEFTIAIRILEMVFFHQKK